MKLLDPTDAATNKLIAAHGALLWVVGWIDSCIFVFYDRVHAHNNNRPLAVQSNSTSPFPIYLNMHPPHQSNPGGKPFLLAVLADWHADRVSMLQEINERPLYPSEEVSSY